MNFCPPDSYLCSETGRWQIVTFPRNSFAIGRAHPILDAAFTILLPREDHSSNGRISEVRLLSSVDRSWMYIRQQSWFCSPSPAEGMLISSGHVHHLQSWLLDSSIALHLISWISILQGLAKQWMFTFKYCNTSCIYDISSSCHRLSGLAWQIDLLQKEDACMTGSWELKLLTSGMLCSLLRPCQEVCSGQRRATPPSDGGFGHERLG